MRPDDGGRTTDDIFLRVRARPCSSVCPEDDPPSPRLRRAGEEEWSFLNPEKTSDALGGIVILIVIVIAVRNFKVQEGNGDYD